MLKKENTKTTHLTIEDRSKIEYGLRNHTPIRQIARDIGKNPTTVMREIRNHSRIIHSRKNNCLNRKDCGVQHSCRNVYCNALCRSQCGRHCFRHCHDYIKTYCDKLSESPYVCNGCSHFRTKDCIYDMAYYSAGEAQATATEELHNKRAGFDLTLEELLFLNDLISPRIKKGQSPYHIAQSISSEVGVSVSTIYRLVSSGELDVRDIDLHEKVRRKPRQSKRRKLHNETVRLSKVGRMWGDFRAFMKAHDTYHVQMDCVEGRQGESATLLTLHWPDFRMQLAFLMEKQDSYHVVEMLDKIEETLGAELFRLAFPLILTDNGQEFSDIRGMERSFFDPEQKRTMVFFCEPNRSDEKGACENNHKMIRDIIPKGSSLEPYMQWDITSMMNHINSYRRKSQFGKCAYDIAMAVFPEDFFILLGLEKIPDNDVTLSPALLAKNRCSRKEELSCSD